MRPNFAVSWEALCIVASAIAIGCYLAGVEQVPGIAQRIIYLAFLTLAPLLYIIQAFRSKLTKETRLLLRWAVPLALVSNWIILPPCWLLTLSDFQERLNSKEMFGRLEAGSYASPEATAIVDAEILPVMTSFPMWKPRCMVAAEGWLKRKWLMHERTNDFRVALEELNKFESYQKSEVIRQAFEGLPKLKNSVLEQRRIFSELERMRASIFESISEDNVELVRSNLVELDKFHTQYQDFEIVKSWYERHRPAIDYYLRAVAIPEAE